MGAEFTPVFLLADRGDRDRRGHDDRERRPGSRARRRKSSKCRTSRGWTRSATPGSDSTFVFIWSRSFFCFSTSSCLFLYPWAVAQWSAGRVRWRDRRGIPAEFRGWVFWEIMVFIVILAAAFAYAWRKGVFEWR